MTNSILPIFSPSTAVGDTNGHQSQSLTWLESNLPPSSNNEPIEEEMKLHQAREEVRLLQAELAQHPQINSELQRDMIKGRKRRDQLCAMMSMIRSETEAVIERYENLI